MKRLPALALLLAALWLSACTGPIAGPVETAGTLPETVSPTTAEPTSAEPTSAAPTTAAETASATPITSTLHIDPADYPRVDGSTATLPLAIAVRSAMTGESPEAAEEETRFTTTGPAWLALMNKTTDLLIVYEASKDIQGQLTTGGANFTKKTIGIDALVFLTNEGNSVQGLTRQQLLDIYTGKTKNWKEVGGADSDIVAFQRDENSGSQTLMKKLVMGDAKMMDAPLELKPEAMDMLVDSLAAYDNTDNALGYSVYYYVHNMYEVPGIKLLAVDGVAPTNDTIAAGQYPYLNPFYAVIRADEPADSPAHKLFDWLTGPEGAAAVAASGYVAANGN